MNVLEVEIKQAGYTEKKEAINNINFSIKRGEMAGLIGPNGAGKSTIIKAILGLLPEIAGKVQFVGQNRNFAYIPEQPVLYEELTLWEHLELAAAVYGIERNIFLDKGEKLLNIFRLQEVKHHFPATFSKGMQQKVMIVIGLIIEPEIYIIDEPFVGLDPRAIMEFLRFLNEERIRGAGILISTHQLDIAERICDTIILIADGQLVAQGKLDEIRRECHLPGASLFDCFNFILEKQS
ncbi:ABC-type transporter ATP-binding protein EcsA [Pelotomaculum sp. FP]|uniref:ABC transporter ATP-binding protein n=1 Tax=Pelotomaculum sp. FP TaxID=261474 RepID=UPI001066F72C|nr:ABC transporter ATP-binding protein [Pelotomaculum sp. FP]TEB14698.1 ABC-type transporter ATP-binding protein EcsA [Pelotomaculum sp. FP]